MPQQQEPPAPKLAETQRLPETSTLAPKPVPTRHASAALSPELQRALDAFTQGHIKYRDLGRAIGVGKDKAGALIQELKRRKLIV